MNENEIIDAEAEHCERAAAAITPGNRWATRRAIRSAIREQRAAARAPLEVEVERLGRSCDANRDVRDQQEAVIATLTNENQHLRAQVDFEQAENKRLRERMVGL